MKAEHWLIVDTHVARWAAIEKAYDVLTDPERKQFYDLHGRVPAGLEDFDMSKLHISE